MAKVLTSRKLTSLKVAAGEGPFEWVLLQMSDRLCACIPVLKRSGGVMLALPELVFSTEELEDGSVGSELPDVGPWLIEAIPVQGTVDDQTVNVLFLDFPLALFGLLRTFQRKAVWPPDTAFFYGTDTAVIPDEEELVLTAQAWVADGKPCAVEGYHTALEEFPSTPRGAAPNAGTQQTLDAVLHQLTNLTSTVSQLQSDMGEMRAGQKPSLTADQPPATRQSALARVTALAGPAPKTRASPVVEVEDAVETPPPSGFHPSCPCVRWGEACVCMEPRYSSWGGKGEECPIRSTGSAHSPPFLFKKGARHSRVWHPGSKLVYTSLINVQTT